jgi:hypothetical protein
MRSDVLTAVHITPIRFTDSEFCLQNTFVYGTEYSLVQL